MAASVTSLTDRAGFLGPARVDPPLSRLPVGLARAALGFPSPAEDFVDDTIDLNELLIRNPPATFLYRADGWSMVEAGILDGDVLIVDRSVEPRDGDVVVALWEGNAPACKVLRILDDRIELESRNAEVPNIALKPGTEAEVFAVVGVVRQMRREHGRIAR
jgi:DNA polymerase V